MPTPTVLMKGICFGASGGTVVKRTRLLMGMIYGPTFEKGGLGVGEQGCVWGVCRERFCVKRRRVTMVREIPAVHTRDRVMELTRHSCVQCVEWVR
jgi:hypothetical protein